MHQSQFFRPRGYLPGITEERIQYAGIAKLYKYNGFLFHPVCFFFPLMHSGDGHQFFFP